MNVKRYQGDLCFSFMCFWCATDPKGEMIGNRKILSAGSTWKNLGLDMPSLDATKKLIEHQVSNSWSLNFYKSLIKWLFMICVHVSECHDMFFTEKIYIYVHISYVYIYTHMRDGSLYAYIYKLSYINNTTWSNLDVSVELPHTRWSRIFSLESRCFSAATSWGTRYFLRSWFQDHYPDIPTNPMYI